MPHSLLAQKRFWRFVEIKSLDECWIWTGAKNECGYGVFNLPTVNGKRRQMRSHRFSYELLRGPISQELDHLCTVRECVNPYHCEDVSTKENVMRGEGIAAYHARKTCCPQGHPYNEKNTYVDNRGSRHCRVCGREGRHKRAS